MSEVVSTSESTFMKALSAAARLPGVRVDREDYLRKSLQRVVSTKDLNRAVEVGPPGAGISVDELRKIAQASIRWETTRTATLSGISGIPGGFGMAVAVPADVVQYFGHMIRISQKLAYLYGWPDLFDDENDHLDDATRGVLTLFLGVMFGVQSANAGVSKLSGMIAEQVAKKLPQKALTQGAVYPVVKKVAGMIGVQMTKQTFARGIAKVVPIVGGVVSAGVTLATFRPMARTLERHFATLELAHPTPQVVDPADDTPA